MSSQRIAGGCYLEVAPADFSEQGDIANMASEDHPSARRSHASTLCQLGGRLMVIRVAESMPVN